MINIIDKHNCCGCAACASICIKQCIRMTSDKEGFLYPQVDKESCVNCGLCEKVCNELNPYDSRKPLKVLAAINKNEDVRMRSSSGGIFYVLANKVIDDGGVVFGARFDEDWQVVLDYAEDKKGVESFMGSKYVQARVEDAYKDVRQFLSEGRKVLFSGTPCQVAGLHKFLHKSYGNLVCVDFICHGVPSPKVWAMYLGDVVREVRRVSGIEFRNKERGWKNFSFHLRYNEVGNTTSVLSSFYRNHYMKAFLKDITLRPSCYDCKAKGGRSHSDITIADFWGIDTVFPEMDDDKGTGLVFINSEKGEYALDKGQIKFSETSYERIKPLNPSCYRSPKTPPKRDKFFARLGKENLMTLIDDCTKPTFNQRLRWIVAQCKSVIKRLLNSIIGGGGKSEGLNIGKITTNESSLTIPEHPQIVSVCFRCKDEGWKKYSMEIKVQ